MGRAHAWMPDAHFNSIACHPPIAEDTDARARLSCALAELEGGGACRLLPEGREAPHPGFPAGITGGGSRTIATLSLDNKGCVHVEPLGARCPELAQEAHARGGLAVVDNSLAGPWMARPLERGADVVVEHLGVWLGVGALALVGRTSVVLERACEELGISRAHGTEGSANGLERLCREGLRMLPLVSARCQRESDTALALASYLEVHRSVARVSYPGLSGDARNDAARRALDHGFGPLLTFVPAGIAPRDVLERARAQRCLRVAASCPDALRFAPSSCDCATIWQVDGDTVALRAGLEDPLDVVEALEAALSYV